MYREAIFLVQNGYATIEDVDRVYRNNTGYWMTLLGVFRWMDLTGIPAYHTVMKDLLPTLDNSTEVPELIDKIVREGGKGVANAHGFYNCTTEEAKCGEETITKFSYEIRKLALKYPYDMVEKKNESEAKGNRLVTFQRVSSSILFIISHAFSAFECTTRSIRFSLIGFSNRLVDFFPVSSIYGGHFFSIAVFGLIHFSFALQLGKPGKSWSILPLIARRELLSVT